MENQEKLKKCPYCAEMIKEEAKVCRFCGKDLEKEEKNKYVNDLIDYIYRNQNIFIEGKYENVKFDYNSGNEIFFTYRFRLFNFLVFFILLLLWVFPAILYLIYCAFNRNKLGRFRITIGENGEIIKLNGISNKFFKTYEKGINISSK